MKSKMKFYEAISLDELSNFLKSNIEELNKNFEILEKNKTEIEKLYQKKVGDTFISFHEWFDDIKNVYESILEEDDDEIYSLVNREFNISKHPLKSFWDKYYYKRLEKNKMSYTISSTPEQTVEIDSNMKKLRETLKIPESILPIYWDIKVSWDKFVIISQTEWRIFGVSIQNKQIALMFKSLLKEIWGKYK
jgi:sugar-specific transcriptional regulator TrmB